jgi:glycine dehydrogenase
MDGANMNAQVGLCRPADFGADVCHLNLHKTFCIPHGGGGPGMGPICVAEHLGPFLPDHPVVPLGHAQSCGTVSAAPWGSAAILPISWAYIAAMGRGGLVQATKVAILNANYIARRLSGHYNLLYSGQHGFVAHECIIDTRPFKQTAGWEWKTSPSASSTMASIRRPFRSRKAGTLMIGRPRASRGRARPVLRRHDRDPRGNPGDRGRADAARQQHPHPRAAHARGPGQGPVGLAVLAERAGFPAPHNRRHKVWPTVGREDAAAGDRNLLCVCPPMETYTEEATVG